MKKLVYLILFIIYSPLFAINNSFSSLDIKGVHGKVLANVEKRLNELQQLKPLDKMSLDELRIQILKAIEPFGYFKANIDIKIINKQKVLINIHPGTQIHITSLNIKLLGEGAKNPLLLKAVKQISLHVGDPLFTELYNQAKQNIINTAENQGYLRGSFKKSEILVDEYKNTASITLLFYTGPLYYFGQVQFDPTNIY